MSWTSQVDDVLVLLCTVPSEDVAQTLARALVDEHLAACVSIVPGLRSIYRWNHQVSEDAELLLVIKTVRPHAEALASRIAELHPYEVPELISLPVTSGLSAYLGWLREQTT